MFHLPFFGKFLIHKTKKGKDKTKKEKKQANKDFSRQLLPTPGQYIQTQGKCHFQGRNDMGNLLSFPRATYIMTPQAIMNCYWHQAVLEPLESGYASIATPFAKSNGAICQSKIDFEPGS